MNTYLYNSAVKSLNMRILFLWFSKDISPDDIISNSETTYSMVRKESCLSLRFQPINKTEIVKALERGINPFKLIN